MKMREILVHSCYLHAGEDPILSDACDLLEKDSNILLWNSLDYFDMLKYNAQKYIFVNGKLPEHVFDHIVEEFKPIKETLDELLDEVDEHKMVVISHVKEYINKRSKGVMIFSDIYPDRPKPHILMYKLDIKQTLPDRKAKHIQFHLPSAIRLDGSHELFDNKDDSSFDMYKGNSSSVHPVSVEKTKTGLAHDHHHLNIHHLFKTEEEEKHPIKAKLIKDYGEEAEVMTLPGEPPKDFDKDFEHTNNMKEEYDHMNEMAILHPPQLHDIPGHDYSPEANHHESHTRKLRISRSLNHGRKFKKWHKLV